MERSRIRKTIALGTLAATACLPEIVSNPQGAEVPSISAASSCSPNDQPKTTEQLLCKDRRIGKLGVVVISNLPVNDPYISYDKKSVLEAATQATTALREMSDGLIDLQPEIIYAPAEVGEEIKARNKGLKDGKNCMDLTEDTENYSRMGQVVKYALPGTQTFASTIVVGSDACKRFDKNPDYYTVSFGTSIYENTYKYVDIFNSNPEKMDKAASLAEWITTVTHEVGHTKGLDHAGIITFAKASSLMRDASQTINLTKLLKGKYTYDEYGDRGNVMSDEGNRLNLFQKDYIKTYAHEKNANSKNNVQQLLPFQPVTVKKDGPLQGVTARMFPGYTIGGYHFDRLDFQPVFKDGKISVDTYLSGNNDLLQISAKLDDFAIPATKPREIVAQSTTIDIQKSSDNKAITFTLNNKLPLPSSLH